MNTKDNEAMTFEEKMKSVSFFVEANSFEQHTLWNTWHVQTAWVQDYKGQYETVGFLANDTLPVVVSFNFAEIYRKRICFYSVTGRYADYEMVDKWIKEKYPVKYDNDKRWAMVDAMNFHNCAHAMRREMKTSLEWANELRSKSGVVIMDPDGWYRKNYQFSFMEEKITKEEFDERLMKSTCIHKIS